MFPELERKIELARRNQDPSVKTLLGLLSKAKNAFDRGQTEWANQIAKRALTEN